MPTAHKKIRWPWQAYAWGALIAGTFLAVTPYAVSALIDSNLRLPGWAIPDLCAYFIVSALAGVWLARWARRPWTSQVGYAICSSVLFGLLGFWALAMEAPERRAGIGNDNPVDHRFFGRTIVDTKQDRQSLIREAETLIGGDKA